VLCGDAGPSPVQRRLVASTLHSFPHRVSVVTSSIVARSIVTVMRWMGGTIVAFSPNDMRAAWTHLNATSEEREWLYVAATELRRLRGIVESASVSSPALR